jgi:hypothetical protein
MIEYCEATPGLQVCYEGNATFFGANSTWLIRPKKLSDTLHANTGKTQYSFDFDHQLPVDVDLIEDLDPTHLYLGYVPTENDPLNPPVYLVCNNEAGAVEWQIHLNPPAPPPAVPITPPAPTPAGPEEPRRVRIKADTATKKADNG